MKNIFTIYLTLLSIVSLSQEGKRVLIYGNLGTISLNDINIQTIVKPSEDFSELSSFGRPIKSKDAGNNIVGRKILYYDWGYIEYVNYNGYWELDAVIIEDPSVFMINNINIDKMNFKGVENALKGIKRAGLKYKDVTINPITKKVNKGLTTAFKLEEGELIDWWIVVVFDADSNKPVRIQIEVPTV